MAKRRTSKAMEATLDAVLVGKIIQQEKKIKSNGHEDSILNKVGQATHVEKEDNNSKPSSPNGNDSASDKQAFSITNTGGSLSEKSSGDSSPLQKNQEDLLKSAKFEMGEVRQENERLKMVLSQIMTDYQSLQTHFHDIVEQEETKKSVGTAPTDQEDEESEVLVSLSLGRASIDQPKKFERKTSNLSKGRENDKSDEGLALGLGCRFNPGPTEHLKNASPSNSYQEFKEEEANETWSNSKSSKTMRSGSDDIIQENPLKKARVSVRAVCDTPTMNDGCQWRKYGQKIAKGNPCPRAYYRCTISPSCPVRKQVQRCVENMSILTTTYEGTHNHPLPVSATAMASTTSAAAAMLMSPSSSSQPGLGASTTTTNANLHGLNFTLTNNTPRSQPFYFPNSTISTSQSHPTITLDFTVPTTNSHFNRLTSSFPSAPRYPSTCLNFSSSLPSWGNGYIGYGTLSNNGSHIGPSFYEKQQPQESFYQNYLLKTETIATATKAITSNPAFRSALAAAITSYVGNGGTGVRENQGRGENSGQGLKWGEPLPVNHALTSNLTGIGCPTSYLNRLPSLSSQQGSSTQFPLPLQFSTSKSSLSPGDKGDHIN